MWFWIFCKMERHWGKTNRRAPDTSYFTWWNTEGPSETKNKSMVGVSVKIWSEIVKKYNLTGHCRFLRWIAHDIDFIPNKLDGRFKLWNNGPKMYWEVIKNKTVMSFQKMKEVYGLQKQDFHRYLQLRQNCNRRN